MTVGIGLSGNLRDFGIADVFQLIGQQRKTGVLELAGPQQRIQLSFDQGFVVFASPVTSRANDPDPLGEMLVRCGLLTRERAAEATTQGRDSAQPVSRIVAERGWVDAEQVRQIEDLLTRDTIFEVLRWQVGSFDFRAQDVEHDREPGSLLAAEQILMDGLRMVDEWQCFGEQVPSEDTVFQRAGRFETFQHKQGQVSAAQLHDAERIFSLVDGRLSARRVIDLSRLGTFDGTRILADLRRLDLIRPLNAEGLQHLRRRARLSVGRSDRVRAAVAALLPLMLLTGTAVLARLNAPVAEEGQGFAIERADLDRARDAYASRRIRNALEAYRFSQGQWPGELADLEEFGLIGSHALAPPPGRPYYYARRSDGIVLLPPER